MRFEWGLLALAFAVRLAAVLWLADTVPYSDFLLYHAAGLEIARDPAFLVDPGTVQRFPPFNLWPPGYPVFLAGIAILLGTDPRHAVLVQVVLGTLVCWMTYRFVARATGETTGRIAALLVALDPTYVFLTNQLASENLFVFWMVLVLGLAGTSLRSRRRAFCLGILMGLGAMTRAIGLVLPLVVLPWARTLAPDRRSWLSGTAWALLGLATILAPWTGRNLAVTGSPALLCFGGGLNFYFGNNAEQLGHRDFSRTPFATLRDPAAIDRAAYRAAWEFIIAEPQKLLTNGGRKFVDLYRFPDYALHVNSGILIPDVRNRPDLESQAQAKRERQRRRDRLLHGPLMFFSRLYAAALLALGAAGILVALRRPQPFLRLCLWIILVWTVAHLFFWGQPRFRYPLDLPFSILSAAALVHFGRAWHRARATLVGTSRTR